MKASFLTTLALLATLGFGSVASAHDRPTAGGHWETRTEVVTDAGHWETRTKKVFVPGPVTYEKRAKVLPGYFYFDECHRNIWVAPRTIYETVAVQQPGTWKTVTEKVWVPGCTHTVTRKVWVADCAPAPAPAPARHRNRDEGFRLSFRFGR